MLSLKFDKFLDILQNWDDIYCHDNPNDMWDAWKKLFFSCVDKHALLRTKRVRSCKSHVNQVYARERSILKMKASRSKDSKGRPFSTSTVS